MRSGARSLRAITAPALDALALLCGLSLPPISQAMRAEWGRSVEPAARSAAFSLATIAQELAVFGGPLLLAVVIAASSPRAAVAVLGSLPVWAPWGSHSRFPAAASGAEAAERPGARVRGALLALVAITFPWDRRWAPCRCRLPRWRQSTPSRRWPAS